MNGLKVEKPLRLLCEFLGERRADCEADGLQISRVHFGWVSAHSLQCNQLHTFPKSVR